MADGILNPIEQLEADFDFDVYTKQEVDALLDEKADKSDTYTKTETDNLLNGKADADDVYTKNEIDTKIPSSVGSATKPVYVNGGVVTECTYELNKTVPANAVFTDTTYTAGNGLNLSGTSFSAKAGANVTVDGNGINVNGNGAVASADSGLINGNTAYNELRPTLDGTWVKNAQTTATNLQKLEGGIEYLYAILSKQYDQLKKYINGNYYDYDTDTDAKYVKSIPNGAMPYASLEQIGGRTVVWNQKYPTDCTTRVNGTYTGITFTLTSDGFTLIGTKSTNNNVTWFFNFVPVSGHVYLIKGTPIDTDIQLAVYQSNGYVYTSGDFIGAITSATCYVGILCNIGVEVNLSWKPQVFDLTLMFGAGNEPTTVAEFQQMFPAQYYSYNAGTLLSAGVTEVVSKDSTDTEIATYPIPAEIQALEGYGWSAGSVYNYIDFEAKKFVQEVGSRAYASGDESDATVITDGTTTYYPLNPAVETDISAYLTDDNLIEVEAGGSLTFPNQNGDDYRIPVPSSETYMVDLQSALGE